MDGQNFDAVTRRLAQSRLSRRLMIGASGIGLGSLSTGAFMARPGVVNAAPVRQARPEATPDGESADAIPIDGTWFCNQTYALCNTAVCERDAVDPSTASCPCVVLNGYSMGFRTCEERAQNGNSLYSTFSTANVNSEFGILVCPENAAWVNCLDYPCELNAEDPALATCQCAVVESGPFRTFGGRCDEGTCTSELLSGTSLDLPGVKQYETGMQMVGQPFLLPKACPEATAAATPEATPAAE